MKTAQHIREQIQSGLPTIGSWMQICNAEVAEIMGRSGYDWVAVDLEHGSFSTVELPSVFRALELGGTLPFARLAHAEARAIKHALDAGARGLIFPMIETAQQLRDAISWSYYPPRGTRGVGYSRANLYGKEFDAYRQTGPGSDLFLVAQIEAIKGITDLNEILAVPGLDAIIIGPYDLSASMGLTAQFDHPDFIAAVAEARDKAKTHGIPMGMHVVQPSPQELDERIADGYQFIAYSIDSVFLYRTAQNPLV